jgi:hypothetical protein
MALKLTYIVCACGAPVDVVEYDDAATSKPVADVMAALNVSEAEARDLVGTKNPGAELTGEEQARALADQIIHRAVPDRDPSTYVCANGHTDHDLHTQEERPLAVPPMIVQVPADVASRLAELEAQAAERTASDE